MKIIEECLYCGGGLIELGYSILECKACDKRFHSFNCKKGKLK